MALGVFILCGCFNIKGVEVTCMATCLPYKTACMPIIDVPIIDNLCYHVLVLLITKATTLECRAMKKNVWTSSSYKSLSISAKKLLYASLVRSQLICKSPTYMETKDIKLIKQLQCRTTKFI